MTVSHDGNVHRVQLLAPLECIKRWEAVKEVIEATSLAEVSRRALRMYETVINCEQNGDQICIRRSDGTEIHVSQHLGD